MELAQIRQLKVTPRATPGATPRATPKMMYYDACPTQTAARPIVTVAPDFSGWDVRAGAIYQVFKRMF